MGMKPPKIRDLGTPAWGSKAALKKLSFTWFPTDFDRFKIGFKTDFRKSLGPKVPKIARAFYLFY